MTTPITPALLIPRVVAIAKEAGAFLASRAGISRIEHKGEINLVTEADIACERLLRDRLLALVPGSSFFAEEEGGERTGEWQWVVDPLDGTNNFAHGIPIWCVSIALRNGGEVVLGVVHVPPFGETFTATKGGGAYLNGEPIRASATGRLIESVVATGFAYDRRTNPQNNLDHFREMALEVQGLRRCGSAAIDLCWLAAGRFDGFWELRLGTWDVDAGILIVREAGGRVTDFGGEPPADPPPHLLATNGHLHDEMMSVLARHPAWKRGTPP
ncbi:inositol monophosphatase [bacterium]|nr:inositol monophosphatase [bacterium]